MLALRHWIIPAMSSVRRMQTLSEQVKDNICLSFHFLHIYDSGLTKLCEDITEVLMELRYETLELDPPA